MSISTPSADPAPAGRKARAAWPAALPLLLGAGLLLALAVRIPAFRDVPGYTDETQEVLLALDIARGAALPLTNMANYIGPLWNYALAGLFLVAGPSPDLARAVMAVLGAACAPLAGWLAARYGGLGAGAVAAGLMATSALGVLLGSHIAWSVCLTPLAFGITLLLADAALRRASGPALAATGLAYGLALHLHPVVGAAGPGLLAALLLSADGRRLLRSRWAIAAALLVALPLAPLAADALAGGFFRQLNGPLHKTTFAPTADPLEAAGRLPFLVIQVLRVVASALDGSSDPTDLLLQPRFDIFLVWLLAGLALAARRRHWLLVLPPLSYAVLWPWVDRNYDLFYESRYALFLLPGLYAAMALPAAALVGAAGRRGPAARLALAAALMLLIAWPLVDLVRYVARQEASGRSVAVVRALVDLADAQGGRDLPLLVDVGLKKPGFGGGSYFDWILFRRGMQEEPTRAVDLNADAAVRELRRTGPQRALLVARPREAGEAGDAYDLREIRRFNSDDDLLFVLYEGVKRR